MRHPNITVQELDKGTKERAEQIARIFSSIPADKEGIFLAVTNAYLDGLVAGQNLKESSGQ